MYLLGTFLCNRFIAVFRDEERKTDVEEPEKPGLLEVEEKEEKLVEDVEQ